MTAQGKAIRDDYAQQARTQWKKKPLSGQLQVSYKLYFSTKRVLRLFKGADWDNFHKLSQDALNGIVWIDDSQIFEANVTKAYDKDNPRIEIELNELP